MFQLWIRKYRKTKGLTQKELAFRTGLTQGYIAALERNDRTKSPTLHTIETIAQALEICPLKIVNCDNCCDNCSKKFW